MILAALISCAALEFQGCFARRVRRVIGSCLASWSWRSLDQERQVRARSTQLPVPADLQCTRPAALINTTCENAPLSTFTGLCEQNPIPT